jgi:hypothetical protein
MPVVSSLFQWLLFSFFLVAHQEGHIATTHEKHPFYIAVTEIKHNEQDKSLEVSCKMFAEDLEAIIEKDYKVTLDITTEKDKARFNQLIPQYITRHLSIKVDGKPVTLSYVGFEQDKESAFCYFEVPHTSSVKSLDINNSILYDFNEGQINIVHAIVGGKRQSMKISYPESAVSFKW